MMMIKTTRARLVAGLMMLGLVASAATPAMGGQVTVGLDNPGGTRTLYVEDLAGNALTALDFGSTRAAPFRVRVVDATMDRAAFTVSATMSNLYIDDAGTIDYTKEIASTNLSISNGTSPLNVLGVSASVVPLVDTVSTITDATICTLLGVVMSVINGASACQVSTSGLTGVLQSAVPATVNLADLANLPLLPQAAEPGAFTAPVYLGVGAADPGKPATWTPTTRRMLSGSPTSTAAVLTALKGALDTNPRSDLITDTTITNGLSATLGLVWGQLSAAQVQTVLNSTVATVQNLLPGQVTAQTGTYLSFPILNVAVPADAAKGRYKGTLVVTALQP